MWLNPQKTVNLVTFTERILNRKLHFCAVRLAERAYKKAEICDIISKAFSKSKKNKLRQSETPNSGIWSLTYNRTVTNVKEAGKKRWNVLKINNEFKDIFAESPLLCFRRNKDSKGFLWRKEIVSKLKDDQQEWIIKAVLVKIMKIMLQISQPNESISTVIKINTQSF